VSYQIQKITKNYKSEAGFIAFAIPLIIFASSLFIIVMTQAIKYQDFYYEAKTLKKINNIKTTLSSYAQHHYRIPCPADPSSKEIGEEHYVKINNSCQYRTGIIPFKELGLSQNSVKDAWGRFITYKINPAFASKTTPKSIFYSDNSNDPLPILKPTLQNQIHQMCRTSRWILKEMDEYIGNDAKKYNIQNQGINKNIHKAKFCCPSYSLNHELIEFEISDYKQEIENKRNKNFNFNNQVKIYSEKIDKLPFWNSKENANKRKSSQNTKSQFPHIQYTERTSFSGDPEASIGPINGSFFNTKAILKINTKAISTQIINIKITNVDKNNWGDPVPVSINIVSKKGGFSERIFYTLKIPETTTKTANIPISLLSILGHEKDEILYSSNLWRGYGEIAKEQFKQNKERFLRLIKQKNINIEDLIISEAHLNAAFAPLHIARISLLSQENNDLFVRHTIDEEKLKTKSSPNFYNAANIIWENPVTQINEKIAYALISHGANGEGSYIASKKSKKITDNIKDKQENPAEILNYANNDNGEIVNIPRTISTNLKQKFDDIVFWQTQLQIMNVVDNNSCEQAY